MQRCLVCGQLCSPGTAFCDTCRVSLLERRERATSEGRLGKAIIEGGNVVEDIHAEAMRELSAEGGGIDLLSLSLLEAAPEESQAGREYALPPLQTSEKYAMSFETSSMYVVEAVDDMDDTECKTSVSQATSLLAIPRPARRAMPRNVRRALLVFCVVGALALLTDGALLALSIMRHHTAQSTRYGQQNIVAAQGISPTTGQTTPTSTVQAQAGTLQLSTQRLVFNAVQGQDSLAAQTVAFSAGQQDFSWLIVPVNGMPAWLHLSSARGNAVSGATTTVGINAQPARLAPGSYTANLLVKAFDSQGNALAGSPGTLQVALNVRAPCTLEVTPAKLSFAAVLVSAPSPQTLTLTESSGCAFPLYWQVSADASWVTF